MTDPLARVLAAEPPPFALLYRPATSAPDRIDVLVGETSAHAALGEVDVDAGDVLLVVPYRQIAERGFERVDDLVPLLALTVRDRAEVGLADVLARIPDIAAETTGGGFDISDDAYAVGVRTVIEQEIGLGVGANFVLKRTWHAEIADYTIAHALAFFARLCTRESGAHWTFVVHTGDRTFVGASPERHITLRGGVAVMNPISGTYRYPPGGSTIEGVVEFLDDRKERDELRMVIDEELKMMAGVCDAGVRVSGPHLKEMSRLAHTEYFIEGRTALDPREILRRTLFAPTVTGSPLESACRVIARHEPGGRRYYSGLVALLGRDSRGEPDLDSAILIRAAEIDPAGRLQLSVGATVVRHSDPDSEAAETTAKAAGLLAALSGRRSLPMAQREVVRAALADCNEGLARFWLDGGGTTAVPDLEGRRAVVIDAEDTFTSMIAHQLRAIGLQVTVRDVLDTSPWGEHDLVVMGPGPGDPSDTADRRVAALHRTIKALLDGDRPFVAVCLSHQVLCGLLGLRVRRCPDSNQGRRRLVNLFGAEELVGFYNSFAAYSNEDKIGNEHVGPIEISRDDTTGEVHALRGARFSSMQFHAESILTEHGPRILVARIREVLAL